MRVHRSSLGTVGHRLESGWIAHLSVDPVLPKVHSLALEALRVGHPWRHLRHAAHVDAGASESLLDQPLGGWNPGSRLARKKEDSKSQRAWVHALAAGDLPEEIGRAAWSGEG